MTTDPWRRLSRLVVMDAPPVDLSEERKRKAQAARRAAIPENVRYWQEKGLTPPGGPFGQLPIATPLEQEQNRGWFAARDPYFRGHNRYEENPHPRDAPEHPHWEKGFRHGLINIEGHKAGLSGRPESDNPHPAGSEENQAWSRGHYGGFRIRDIPRQEARSKGLHLTSKLGEIAQMTGQRSPGKRPKLSEYGSTSPGPEEEVSRAYREGYHAQKAARTIKSKLPRMPRKANDRDL